MFVATSNLVVPLAIGTQQASRRPSPSRSVSKAEWHGEERSKLWSGNENMLPCPGGGQYIHRKVLRENGGQQKHGAWEGWQGQVSVSDGVQLKGLFQRGSAQRRLGTAGIRDAKPAWESTGLTECFAFKNLAPSSRCQETGILTAFG